MYIHILRYPTSTYIHTTTKQENRYCIVWYHTTIHTIKYPCIIHGIIIRDITMYHTSYPYIVTHRDDNHPFKRFGFV